ncbi:DUF4870 domain-containing protein [Chitinophaga silvatica]|uniref:DUF4870 domain-containing protein n=1 Tax=Chitinophaga silvatica TaxID=2282649 RepID=A0A3E1Y5J1_9BACT|nr:helix-turn-helix domain-containing protein [Chitinophaga silvatica]RFS20003.1 DUF4870 domain-containing protein [Chitinophaga silvatica]
MKKTLKEHRAIQQLSQQELADRSGISLRTIQRLEKNASTGSAYVIRTLCSTLKIEIEDLFIESEKNTKEEEDMIPGRPASFIDDTSAKNKYSIYLKYINFSTLTSLIFPFLGLIISPVFYLLYKKKLTENTDRQAALKILSFQILWAAFTLALLIFTPLIDYLFLHVSEIEEIPLFMWVYLILLFFHLLSTLLTAIRLNRGNRLLPLVPNIL